jgi:hypothetical protein
MISRDKSQSNIFLTVLRHQQEIFKKITILPDRKRLEGEKWVKGKDSFIFCVIQVIEDDYIRRLDNNEHAESLV